MNKKNVAKLINIYLVVVLLICLVVVAQAFQQPTQKRQAAPSVFSQEEKLDQSAPRKADQHERTKNIIWDNIGGPSRTPYWYETNCELSAQGEYINCP